MSLFTGAVALATAIGAATATTVAASKQSGAVTDAAKLQTDAANHAADVQAKSAADTLAWNKQQAEQQWQQQETDRKANYDQWAAKRRNIGSIGQFLGLGIGGDIPGYVPSVDPRYVNGGTPLPAGAGQTPAAAAAQPGAMTAPPPASIGAAVTNGPTRTVVPFHGMLPPPPASPSGVDPRLMGGNTGVVPPGGGGTPVLQPDGTYAIPGSLPRYGSLGAYLGAA